MFSFRAASFNKFELSYDFEMAYVCVWQRVWVGGCVQRKLLIGMT